MISSAKEVAPHEASSAATAAVRETVRAHQVPERDQTDRSPPIEEREAAVRSQVLVKTSTRSTEMMLPLNMAISVKGNGEGACII